MGKLSNLAGVIGDFFTEGENLSPGEALHRVNRATSANDFAVVPIDGSGAIVPVDQAIGFQLIEVSNTAAIKADQEGAGSAFYDKITGVQSGGGWSFDVSTAGAGAVAIDTGDANRKGFTLVDQVLEQKTRPSGFAASSTNTIYALVWAQSENCFYLVLSPVSGTLPSGDEFARVTAASGAADFGE